MPANKKNNASSAVIAARRIQRATDVTDRRRAKALSKSRHVMQAGLRKLPSNPLPAQHLRKPGLEKDLKQPPQFLAPDYFGSRKLAGKVALITGGDSGIGRAVAVLFAREGAQVAIVYLNEHDDAQETQTHINREGSDCLLIAGDVRKQAFCNRAVAKVVKTFGKLDILVNNAAFQEHAASIEEISEEQFDLTFKTNIYGYFHMAKAAVPHLKKGGCIINSGSETAMFGSNELLDYSATKGAIHAFTRSLARNLLKRDIRVNAVAPGPVWTPLNPADRGAREVRDFGKTSDMHRPAQPEEIAPAYVFLASPICASYITGTVLPVLGSIAAGG